MRKLVILFFFFLLVHTSGAEITEHLEYTYYSANIDSKSSINAALKASSPVKKEGHLFYGDTEWHLKWKFRWKKFADGNYKISNATVEVTGNIILPKLSGSPTPTQEKKFEKFFSALRVHELGHYTLAKEAAVELEKQILALPEMSTGKDLNSAANGIGYQKIKELKEKQKQYDAETGHGKTQGAWING
ncbi:MAG: DUF922 domain-containing protein [Candidatus Riflebacteria bacterium]|nr:DUF922 domain-containing protein [Candidatus Riflebacteria bacterium]